MQEEAARAQQKHVELQNKLRKRKEKKENQSREKKGTKITPRQGYKKKK